MMPNPVEAIQRELDKARKTISELQSDDSTKLLQEEIDEARSDRSLLLEEVKSLRAEAASNEKALKRGKQAENLATILKADNELVRANLVSLKTELEGRYKEIAQATIDIRVLKAEITQLHTKHGHLPGSQPTHDRNRKPGSSTRIRKSRR